MKSGGDKRYYIPPTLKSGGDMSPPSPACVPFADLPKYSKTLHEPQASYVGRVCEIWNLTVI